MDLKALRKNLVKKVQQYSPEILTGIGIGGFVTAIFMASKAGVEAQELIEERKLDTGKDELTKREIVETTWKCYIPTAITATSATACIVGAAAKNRKRYTGLAAAYSLSQETMSLYRQKVIETLGEKKESAVRDEVAKEKYEKRDKEQQTIVIASKGETNCYDPIIKRSFKCDIESLRTSINNVSGMVSDELSASYNDYLYDVGLGKYASEVFDDIGWGLEDFPIKPHFTYGPDDDGNPCLIVDWETPPHYIGR